MFAINSKTPTVVHLITAEQAKEFGPEYLVIKNERALEDYPTQDILTLYNAFADSPTRRFSTRENGIQRLYRLLKDKAQRYNGPELVTSFDEETREIEVSTKTGNKPSSGRVSAPITTHKEKIDKGVNREPKPRVYRAREGTKTAILIDLLSREEEDGTQLGATATELAEAISGFGKSWVGREDKIKDWLRWDVNSVKGYGVQVLGHRNGEVVYGLVYPEGVKKPLPHLPSKKRR